jgi:hypothetical protein
MASYAKLQDLEQSVRLFARDSGSGLDAVNVNVYDLAVHAFMSEVLTLERMTRVVQSVRKGIEDSTDHEFTKNTPGDTTFQRQAYRGLCTAANEGLIATGLAFTLFCKLNGNRLSADLEKALLHNGLEFKIQLDQITTNAAWLSINPVTLLQAHWFDQLFHVRKPDSKQGTISAIPWSRSFFQACGYETQTKKNYVEENLMLLGLITSGVLAGLQAS